VIDRPLAWVVAYSIKHGTVIVHVEDGCKRLKALIAIQYVKYLRNKSRREQGGRGQGVRGQGVLEQDVLIFHD